MCGRSLSSLRASGLATALQVVLKPKLLLVGKKLLIHGLMISIFPQIHLFLLHSLPN
ncbi:MAG: hypothetical protein RM022_029070 [Nostoc sp. EfeVER01]|uniref:hypothetical protein n=1 Tax=Nostoc sp. EfeVER01 TaxID=3075406 RepID=UPI002AD1E493|nr:hypothetical protein [Nostoc sp. EfeVER01]MDZ7947937.1 hypothetical protein [Nostoc sp. EfeVER01]